jgi:hypothetical protein
MDFTLKDFAPRRVSERQERSAEDVIYRRELWRQNCHCQVMFLITKQKTLNAFTVQAKLPSFVIGRNLKKQMDVSWTLRELFMLLLQLY